MKQVSEEPGEPALTRSADVSGVLKQAQLLTDTFIPGFNHARLSHSLCPPASTIPGRPIPPMEGGNAAALRGSP